MESKKRKISWIGYGLRALNWIAIISIIIAYFSRYISPNTLWFPAFFGLAYPIIFLVNLYFVFHWLLFRRWFVIYPLIAIAIGFSLPAKYIGFGSNVEYTDKDNSFKIMTYNVHDFDYYSHTYSQGNNALNIIFQHIKKENPDVVCFQEFYSNPIKSDKNNFRKFRKESDYKYVTRYKYNNRSSYLFLVIYSKFPIINDGFVNNAPGNKDITGVYSDIKFNKSIIRIYNVHLNSTQISSESYLIQENYNVTKKEDVKKAASGAKKIAGRMRAGYRKRALQAEMLKKHIASSPYPVVLAGDFNDTPCSYSYQEISTELTDVFIESGKGFSTTYAGVYPSFRIDFIFHDKYFRSHSYQRVKVKASDHYPIQAVMILNKGGVQDEK